MNGMRERGVLISTTGRDGNVLKIRPPLVLTDGQAMLIVAALDEALAAATS
jgi:4-aminobutyrate aminotransferase-like enzyme